SARGPGTSALRRSVICVKRTDVACGTDDSPRHPPDALRAAAGRAARGRVPVLRRPAEPRGDHAAAAALPAPHAPADRDGPRDLPAVRAANPRRPGALGHADPGMG